MKDDIQTYATDQWTEQDQKTNGQPKPQAKRSIPQANTDKSGGTKA
ncbi:hypothetical protein RAC89_16830 [Paenibacillus sp. GD4]|jgi:hypothetical protein|nr:MULTISPECIES: hypothetical protein [Paenibacillus]MDQ1912051.1 hypothetical protein [Paenibacillus sp. GD4]